MKNHIFNLHRIIQNIGDQYQIPPHNIINRTTIEHPDEETGLFTLTLKNNMPKAADFIELNNKINHELHHALNDYLLTEGTFTYNLNRQQELYYNSDQIIWTNDFCDTIIIHFADESINITIYQSGQYD